MDDRFAIPTAVDIHLRSGRGGLRGVVAKSFHDTRNRDRPRSHGAPIAGSTQQDSEPLLAEPAVQVDRVPDVSTRSGLVVDLVQADDVAHSLGLFWPSDVV